MTTKTERIRALNDKLRATHRGGKVMLTSGIADLPAPELLEVMTAVRTFNAFTPDNDPYGEHDFGSLTVAGHRVMFKIDYYDLALVGGSDDPSDPAQTCRVLTILLASEY